MHEGQLPGQWQVLHARVRLPRVPPNALLPTLHRAPNLPLPHAGCQQRKDNTTNPPVKHCLPLRWRQPDAENHVFDCVPRTAELLLDQLAGPLSAAPPPHVAPTLAPAAATANATAAAGAAVDAG